MVKAKAIAVTVGTSSQLATALKVLPSIISFGNRCILHATPCRLILLSQITYSPYYGAAAHRAGHLVWWSDEGDARTQEWLKSSSFWNSSIGEVANAVCHDAEEVRDGCQGLGSSPMP